MYIPHIRMLQTINGHYFYDVNRNEIVSISEQSAHYLRDVLAGHKNFGEALPDELYLLAQHGYLSNNTPKEIEHPYTDLLPYVLDRKLRKITLQVTQGCNFRCKYCVYSNDDGNRQRKHQNITMSLETAIKAVEFLADHSVDSEQVNIGFYGGEPLLEFDLVKEVVSYAKKRFAGKKLTFSLTTNASLLTREIVSFLDENNIPLLISLDGPKEIQDKNRVMADGKTGTFELVKEKLRMVKDEFPDFFSEMSVNMVVDPQNSFELIRTLENDDVFKDLQYQISMLDEEYTPFLQENGSLEKRYSETFIEEYRYLDFIANLAFIERLEEKDLPKVMASAYNNAKKTSRSFISHGSLPEKAAPGGPCLPGQKRLFIDVHGNLFPCERVSETAECMCIGNLDDGYDIDQAKTLLNVGAITAERCKKCWAFAHCTVCAKTADHDGKLDVKKKLAHCENIRSTVKDNMYCYLLKKEAYSFYK